MSPATAHSSSGAPCRASSRCRARTTSPTARAVRLQRRKTPILIGVVTGMVQHTRPGQVPARPNEAVDLALRVLLPADIERAELWEELQLAVGEVIVDPPRHRLPRGALQQTIGEPRDDDAGHRAHAPARIAAVPDMTRVIALVRRAIVMVRVAIRVHCMRTIRRTDR